MNNGGGVAPLTLAGVLVLITEVRVTKRFPQGMARQAIALIVLILIAAVAGRSPAAPITRGLAYLLLLGVTVAYVPQLVNGSANPRSAPTPGPTRQNRAV